MKICSAAAGLGLAHSLNPAVARALGGALDGSRPPVIWIKGLACGTCTASLLSGAHPDISEIFSKLINLEFHPGLTGAEGAPALANMFKVARDFRGKYFLVLEGAVPLADQGRYALCGELDGRAYTTGDLLRLLAPAASAVLAVGTCAAFGGVAAAAGNPTGSVGLSAFLQEAKISVPLVNIAGCAPHPDWIAGSLAYTLDFFAARAPREAVAELADALDAYNRPQLYYANVLHEACPHLDEYRQGLMAASLMDEAGCRRKLGCKGPQTYADCAARQWNNATNWCVKSAVCTGCTEPGFPDAMSPFYSG